jgi:hypothetical protein
MFQILTEKIENIYEEEHQENKNKYFENGNLFEMKEKLLDNEEKNLFNNGESLNRDKINNKDKIEI